MYMLNNDILLPYTEEKNFVFMEIFVVCLSLQPLLASRRAF